MGCCKKLGKFSQVLVKVLIFKLTVSGFDIVSDGSTAFELQHMGSPLGDITRMASDYVHDTTGWSLTTSDDVGIIFQALKGELRDLRNRTTEEARTLPVNETFDKRMSKQVSSFTDILEETVYAKFQEINEKLANSSRELRISRFLKGAEGEIQMVLDEEIVEDEESLQSISLDQQIKDSLNMTETKLSDIEQKLRIFLSQSPEQELVEILYGVKEKICVEMEKQVADFKEFVSMSQNETERISSIRSFMNIGENEVLTILNHTIEITELVMSEINPSSMNDMYLDTSELAEKMNTIILNISETFELTTQEILTSKGNAEQIEHFEKLQESVLFFVYGTVDHIVKVHPIWSMMTFILIFSPGLVFGINALAICKDRSRMFEDQEESKDLRSSYVGFLFLILFPLLTFCFPIGVLTSQICEIFIVPFGSKGMVTSIQYITDMATGFEAFLESSPQIILQLYIIFNTGIVSRTQVVSIAFSMFMLAKTTVMYDLMGSDKKFKNTLMYLLIHIPMYLGSGYFRLGSLTLSCIFFGYWTILPVVVLFFILCHHASHEMQFPKGDSAVLGLSNLFVMCLGPYKNDPNLTTAPRHDFLKTSSLICFGIYSTILSSLLYVLNDFGGKLLKFGKWENLYMNPTDPDDLLKLNLIISSLIISGFLSLVLFRLRNKWRCCEKVLEKAEPGQLKCMHCGREFSYKSSRIDHIRSKPECQNQPGISLYDLKQFNRQLNTEKTKLETRNQQLAKANQQVEKEKENIKSELSKQIKQLKEEKKKASRKSRVSISPPTVEALENDSTEVNNTNQTSAHAVELASKIKEKEKEKMEKEPTRLSKELSEQSSQV